MPDFRDGAPLAGLIERTFEEVILLSGWAQASDKYRNPVEEKKLTPDFKVL
jgi:hypothetical protein